MILYSYVVQGISLQFDSTSIQHSFENILPTLFEQLSPELPHTSFVTDLAFIMIIGSVVTLAFFKIKQPLIIGYLFAGMLLGPLSPLWSWFLPEALHLSDSSHILQDITSLHLFAEIGVILLLFVIGIEFPFAKIKQIGRTAAGAGTIGLFSTLGVVFYAALGLGLNFMDSLFIAAALSISSTAVILKILEDAGRIKKDSSILVLGILIVEDIIAVILISSLQSVVLAGSVSVESIVVSLLVAIGLFVGTFTIGIRVIPRLVDKVADTQHREILLLSVLGVCFGYALLANLIGLSVAIGAFLAGVLIAESKSSDVSNMITNPIKDMFVAVFFVSVGALMDISQIEHYFFISIILIAVATGMKLGGSLLGSLFFKQGRAKALRSSLMLSAPRGEFSIVIIKTGIDLGAVSAFLFPMIGIISIITTFMTPFLDKVSTKLLARLHEEDV